MGNKTRLVPGFVFILSSLRPFFYCIHLFIPMYTLIHRQKKLLWFWYPTVFKCLVVAISPLKPQTFPYLIKELQSVLLHPPLVSDINRTVWACNYEWGRSVPLKVTLRMKNRGIAVIENSLCNIRRAISGNTARPVLQGAAIFLCV